MHLAQLNIARLRADRDDPMVADFFAAIDPINAIADVSPGFVWRLQEEPGDATAIRPWDDDRLIVNLSVWESIEALDEYVYRGAHTGVMRRRREWFERLGQRFMVLWWVPPGHRPDVDEAKARLAHIERHEPTPHAFTFRRAFAASGEEMTRLDRGADSSDQAAAAPVV
ncbi:MAG: DUF3291 domain-containing protein [Chloroflexota bacterium]